MGAQSFEDWYRQAHPRLLAAVALLTGELETALDITSEAFARALERWDRVADMDNPTGWTYTVALNLVRRRHRRWRRERRAAARAYEPIRSTPNDDTALAVWTAVRALPPRARTAVVLRYLGDLSEREVASIMGVAPGTAAATLSVARRQLARSLADLAPGATQEEVQP